MSTQIIFGETFEILELQKKWVRIRNSADLYECWIDRKQFHPISEAEFRTLTAGPKFISQNIIDLLHNSSFDQNVPIPGGSVLPQIIDKEFKLAGFKFSFEGELSSFAPSSFSRENIIEIAVSYLNAPYLWGGKTVFGIDCSGFSQTVYKINGIQLPRDAYEQAEKGVALSFLEEAEPGDLAFFDNEEGKIIHVGIIYSHNKIIHASGKVRLDDIDHYGIFNKETGSYTHKLRIVKRMVD